jgi:predicted nucleic acid-binding protein
MDKILVDSSIWIDYFNGVATPQTNRLTKLLIDDEPVCTCPTIIQEVLQGLSKGKSFEQVKSNLLQQEILICDPVLAAVKSAELFSGLPSKGITIRKSNDCLIAYHALHFDVEVFYHDRDFDNISEHTPLRVFRA